jgi:hypothetical protein
MEREHGDLADQAGLVECDDLLKASEALRATSRELRERSRQASEMSVALRARCCKRETGRRAAVAGRAARALA